MKFKYVCPHCRMDAVEQNKSPKIKMLYEQISDSGNYLIKCKNGHESFFVDGNEKYQQLFESGAHAFLDGYYREAISTWAVSLERFYEFAVKIFLNHSNVPHELQNEVWTVMQNQSERQLGAFYTLYTSKLCRTYKPVPKKFVELRNQVTHKGLFPDYQKTYEYGEFIFKNIFETVDEIRQFSEIDYIQTVAHGSGIKAKSVPPNVGIVCYMTMPCMLTMGTNDDNGRIVISKFEDKLRELEKSIKVTVDSN